MAERGLKRWKVTHPTGSPMLAFTLTEALSLYLGRSFLQPLAGTYFWEGAQSAFRKVRVHLSDSVLAYVERMSQAIAQTLARWATIRTDRSSLTRC